MLATIVVDAYLQGETKEVAEVLNELLEGNCWSTAGVYCFWDYDTHEALYIGLATDLHQRFLQHNGLARCQASACKKNQIKDYFTKKSRLGFTIMLQSSLSQPLTKKQERKFHDFWKNADESNKEDFGADGLMNIRLMEGVIIETVKSNTGVFPKWNGVGGSLEGQKRVTNKHVELLELLTNKQVNDNVSRATLRELHTNGWGAFECFLHGLRISMYSLQKALDLNRSIGNGFIIDEIEKTKYLSKKLAV